jgi:hypothetical protein
MGRDIKTPGHDVTKGLKVTIVWNVSIFREKWTLNK